MLPHIHRLSVNVVNVAEAWILKLRLCSWRCCDAVWIKQHSSSWGQETVELWRWQVGEAQRQTETKWAADAISEADLSERCCAAWVKSRWRGGGRLYMVINTHPDEETGSISSDYKYFSGSKCQKTVWCKRRIWSWAKVLKLQGLFLFPVLFSEWLLTENNMVFLNIAHLKSRHKCNSCYFYSVNV